MARVQRRGRAAVAAVLLAATLLVLGHRVLAAPSTSVEGRLRLNGRVHGLAPGLAKRMSVRITNRYAIPLRIETISVEADSTDRSGCSPSMLRAVPFPTQRLLRPMSTRGFRVLVSMNAEASDACQGATFTLTLRATAVEP